MLWQLINGLAIGLVLAYLGLCLFAVFFSDRMIFPVPPRSYKDTKEIIRLPLPRSNTEIAALYLPNPEAKFTILYSHGNAEDLGNIRPFLGDLRDQGFAVMAYDYPGYGTSDGRPSEQGCNEAISAVFSYLVVLRDVDPDSIILFGRSLGGGPTIALASKKVVAGVITDGTYSSTFRVVTRRKLVPWDKFDNLALINQIQCPLLIIHGTQDRTVPFSHAQALFDKAKEPKTAFFVDDAGHNNLIERAGSRYWDAIDTFTKSLPEPHE
ncbi:alpha/beta hydrolase [Cerasicoccus arenae]|uniref:Alpha/beta hydrolase n=1 Tax=Cerasicoccus arenae TaxID=424488 RepID=A0A8J3DGS2_9BACT|nr:alpha/beta hydrolase [Cerasicoccus arenae]MBK1859760.1 alpha/beta hydrolase [Cerasicoccus arenae]GHB90983.1 alpha/beta hydrolase [Cerasicoccus arenae]